MQSVMDGYFNNLGWEPWLLVCSALGNAVGWGHRWCNSSVPILGTATRCSQHGTDAQRWQPRRRIAQTPPREGLSDHLGPSSSQLSMIRTT